MAVAAETANELNDLAMTSRPATEHIVGDALAGCGEEVASVRTMHNTRYDDLEIGRVKLADGEGAFKQLREKRERRSW